jgi:uncharacterized membrane protein YccC
MASLTHALSLVVAAAAAMPVMEKYNYIVMGGSMTECLLVNLAVPSGMEVHPPTLAPV